MQCRSAKRKCESTDRPDQCQNCMAKGEKCERRPKQSNRTRLSKEPASSSSSGDVSSRWEIPHLTGSQVWKDDALATQSLVQDVDVEAGLKGRSLDMGPGSGLMRGFMTFRRID